MGAIVTGEEFLPLRKRFRKEKKKVILCHGVFDLVHPGHLIHFEEAKSLGDVLVVSVTASAYVRKGPGRPYFDDELRLKFLSSMEVVDYVILSENYTVDDVVETVEPDLYVKGDEYAKPEDDITGKIDEEAELVRRHGGDVYFTSGQTFSSTRLINKSLDVMPPEVKGFMAGLLERHSFQDVKDYIERMDKLKVLVVGDVIIDEYLFCSMQGLMSKDMGYSVRYEYEEQYLGGSLAVARHVAGFSSNVTVMSVVGNEERVHSRILNDLGQMMKIDIEYAEEHDTIRKKRFITKNDKREEFNKIFSINHLPDDAKVDGEAKGRFRRRLAEAAPNFDLVVLCDFGHGLVDGEVMDVLQKKAKFLAVNCQTNSSNYGMNIITKYARADAFTLDQKEIRLAFRSNDADEKLLRLLHGHFRGKAGWLTQGALGALGVGKEADVVHCPALTLTVKDTVGAGDAFFSLASLCAATDVPCEVGTFLGNVAGALAANIIGNKKAVDKVDALKFVSTLMNV